MFFALILVAIIFIYEIIINFLIFGINTMDLIDLIISPAYAQDVGSSAGAFSSFLPLILLIVVFYFLLIRPQSKRAKEHKKLLSELKKGDEVVSNGGVVGKIVKVEESFVEVEIAKNVIVKIQRQAINQKVPKGTIKS